MLEYRLSVDDDEIDDYDQESNINVDDDLGEYLLDWDDVVGTDDPFSTAFAFGRALVAHACEVCGWDPALAASATGVVPALT